MAVGYAQGCKGVESASFLKKRSKKRLVLGAQAPPSPMPNRHGREKGHPRRPASKRRTAAGQPADFATTLNRFFANPRYFHRLGDRGTTLNNPIQYVREPNRDQIEALLTALETAVPRILKSLDRAIADADVLKSFLESTSPGPPAPRCASHNHDGGWVSGATPIIPPFK